MKQHDMGDQVLRTLRKIIRALDRHSKQLAHSSGLTGPQIVVLRAIKRAGLPPVSAIAHRVSLSHATVTDILNRLHARGLVNRVRDEKDKRRILVSLSEEGQKALAHSPPVLQASFLDDFERLPDWEKTLMLSTLQKLASLMQRNEPLLEAANRDMESPEPADFPELEQNQAV